MQFVRNGLDTSFQDDVWAGSSDLKTQFPHMFLISEQKKDSLVGNLGSMIGSEWVWDLKWWINLFVWEEGQLAELLALISAVNISLASDSWVWKGDPLVSFFFKSPYQLISSCGFVHVDPRPYRTLILANPLHSWAPLKAVTFSQQLIRDRIPTHDNLFKIWVIADQSATSCVFCGLTEESVNRIFNTCSMAQSVQYNVCRWLRWTHVAPSGLLGMVAIFLEFGSWRHFILELYLAWKYVV